MSTLRVNTLQDVAGTGQPAMVGAAKAWVNFNGTGTVTIRAAFNVSSITDNGTGDYTANFTTALADASYSITGLVQESAAVGGFNRALTVDVLAAGSARVLAYYPAGQTLQDVEGVFVAIFR